MIGAFVFIIASSAQEPTLCSVEFNFIKTPDGLKGQSKFYEIDEEVLFSFEPFSEFSTVSEHFVNETELISSAGGAPLFPKDIRHRIELNDLPDIVFLL